MNIIKTISLFFILASTTIVFAGKPDIISRIQTTEQIPVFYIGDIINVEGVNGVCKGVQDEIIVPHSYKNVIFSAFVENLKLDYKTKKFRMDTSSFNYDKIKKLDSTVITGKLFFVLEISGSYSSEQDFSSNTPGNYLSRLIMRAHLKVYEINDKNKIKLLNVNSKQICEVNSKKSEHRGCLYTIEDHLRFVKPETLITSLKSELSKGQKVIAQKDWKKHK